MSGTPSPTWAFDPNQMLVVDGPSAGSSRSAGAALLRRLPAVTRTARFRMLLVVGVVVVAYHYSLTTLMRTLGLDTPLAYLGLVPFMALGLAAMRGRPTRDEPEIHDRQVDFIVGVPLVAAAVAAVLLLPDRLSTLFWVYRIDLLSLPFFVAGLVALVFGVRTLWRLRFPVGFLFLAWPVPFSYALDHGLTGFTSVTLAALRGALAVIPINATNVAGNDGSLFSIGSGAQAFQVSVASACAGVDGVVGFLLVGVAFTALVKGNKLPKYLWLISGLTLIYSLNLARLLLLFWAGDKFGQGVAIDGLHPFIGLLLFCLGVAVMIRTMGLFGLTVASPDVSASLTAPAAPPMPAAPVLVGDPTRRERKVASRARSKAVRANRPATPRWVLGGGLRAAGSLAVVIAIVLGVNNGGMRKYELFAGDLGAPRLASFLTQPVQVKDFSVTQIAQYDWAQRFFGGDSTWRRYQYLDTNPQLVSTGGVAGVDIPIIADVIQTGSLRRFAAYGVEACYRFHGYDIVGQSTHTLSGGVQAEMLTYSNAEDSRDWNALYWIWPVKTADGTKYERVVLLAPSVRAAAPSATADGAAISTAAFTPGSSTDPDTVRRALVGFGESVVTSAGTAADAAAATTTAAR